MRSIHFKMGKEIMLFSMGLKVMGSESGSGMHLAEDHVEWFTLVSPVLNLRLLLPESLLIT
jgi:hypothetical protein